ncbi:hypothetical protein OG866_24880 [Streptomyces sp. NBC_00663]|uniref:hypothetical protein n=1 Tax=Streptomyces sp. NBC_00663 TaxID=2975801 RepID=UPI002E31333F|nr:hypothetical protein [Streptomyces sp. NBC_00663]
MVKRMSGTALSAASVLLASLTACTGTGGTASPSITAPAVFYLRPPGDKAGPHDKMPYSLVAEDTGGPGARTLTADVPKGAEDTVVIRKYGGCTGSSAHVTCEVDGDYSNWADAPRAKVVAAKGAKAGDSAVVTYTYTTKGGEKLTARTRFVVGEPVVEAVAPESVDDVRPGSRLTEPIVVRNTGEVPARGLGLELRVSGTEFDTRYANCRYPGLQKGTIAVCEFPDLVLDPGETVTLAPALGIRAPETRMYTSYGKDVWALDMGPGHYATVHKGGDHGEGPALEPRPFGKDTGDAFVAGGGSTYVVLDTYADYEVSAVDLKGDPGDKKTFEIEVHNNGPADVGSPVRLVFEPPLGMSMVKQPMTEYDDGVYEPYCESNGFTYTCDVKSLKPGESQSLEFTMTLGDPGEGTLTLENKKPFGPWDVGRRDPDAGNDTAVIRVSR